MRRKKIFKMKLQFSFVSFIFCTAVGFLLLPGLILGSCLINDISLEKVGNFTKLTIYADKPFEFVHSTLERKDGKPYRVIVDCKDAIFNLPQHNFKKDIPAGMIKAIRTSQFQTEPEKIVRVVLDLDKPVIYKVVEKGEEKRGAIAILTAQEPDFPIWSAARNEKVVSESKLASSVSPKKTTKEMSEAEPETEKKEMVLATVSPEIFSVPYRKDKKLQSEQVEDKEVGTDVKKGASESSSKHFGEKEYIQEKPLLSQEETISSTDEVEKATKAPPEENKSDSMDLTAKEEKVAFLPGEEKSKKEKGGAPESLVVLSKPKGTTLQMAPKRRVICYHGEGKRDPFVPLTQRITTEFGEIPLPTFESLKLVGILKDENGNQALLEDERGYGYIMKNGDRIKNGYVVSVEESKVIFQIQEYGWSKTIALEFSIEYQK